jgi:hypothetical protein
VYDLIDQCSVLGFQFSVAAAGRILQTENRKHAATLTRAAQAAIIVAAARGDVRQYAPRHPSEQV